MHLVSEVNISGETILGNSLSTEPVEIPEDYNHSAIKRLISYHYISIYIFSFFYTLKINILFDLTGKIEFFEIYKGKRQVCIIHLS